MVISHTGGTNYQCLPVTELDWGARSLAGDAEVGRVGRPWDGRAAAEGRMALESSQF